VTVVDVATNKPIGRIEVGPQPHGIAAPASQNVILVTLEGGKKGELVWIDPLADKVTKRMTIGPGPNAHAVTPDGKFAYVPVSDGHYEVIDLAQEKIIKRIKTGGRPHNTVCSKDGKYMYLAPMGASKKVTVVEVATHSVIGHIPFSDVVRPIALTDDGKSLFAEVDGLVGIEMAAVASRKMIHRVPSTLSPEDQKKPSRSHGLAIRPDQKEAWACDVEHKQVHVFDITAEKPKQVSAIPVRGSPYWLTFAPDGKTCYVSLRTKNEVVAIDTQTREVVAHIPVGSFPKRLTVVTVPAKAEKD
jgi:YVTN family beta-propeller protein